MKPSFILGKKQIILASLVLILGVAVYLNWAFASKDQDLSLTSTLDQTQQTGDKVLTDDEIAGQTNVDPNAKKDEADANAKADVTAKEGTDKGTDANADAANKETNKGKSLGDTLLVDSKSIVDENYFAMAKLSRTKARDSAIETISAVISDDKLSDSDKKEASAKAMAITDVIEAESRIENLIKAKGYEDCIVFLTQTSANVVVKSDGLDQNSATQIKNIIVSEGKIAGENVTITEIG